MSDQVTVAEPAQQSERITPQQWRSGIAAWLGWFFDGLDIHLYSLVATAFVAQLLVVADATTDAARTEINQKASFIQAGFLVGWAIGGGIFGWLGDRIGRSRALSLTILTYAIFTGLSCIAHSWQELFVYRFISALGIGGEWAVGASLLSETWPRKWRAVIAAVLQCAVNMGILIACVCAWLLTYFSEPGHGVPDSVLNWFVDRSKIAPGAGTGFERYLFLVGVIPAFAVLWIRKKVPEPAAWTDARAQAGREMPRFLDLFRGKTLRTTLCSIGVCGLSLTAWWAFLFWNPIYLKSLPSLQNTFDKVTQREEYLAFQSGVDRLALVSFFLVIGVSLFGNFFGTLVARRFGYRNGIIIMFAGFFAAALLSFGIRWQDHRALMACMAMVGFFSGVFGLFTMYLPPLFPTLLRTTGAGFCYNLGRIFSASGVVIFGLYAKVDTQNLRMALIIDGSLMVGAILVALFMPDLRDQGNKDPGNEPAAFHGAG
jgi:MFS family permease